MPSTIRRIFISGLLVALLIATAMAHEGKHDGKYSHGTKHATTLDVGRFFTSRHSNIKLPLPEEKDAFFFVVFGDRTGGPSEGIKILEQAVKDTNVLEPDLVMTVGDLVNGYNQTGEWMTQMREFKGVMGGLVCPWFPVAGNHDIYWRGPNRPEGEHEKDYEMHFGPLWYAFEHKDCWFITLYSDEGNSKTGKKTFNDEAAQRMSPEQFAWLKKILKKAKGAKHVFVFLHHPRWLGKKGARGYGNDWDKVHKELVAAGNVSAVFAGHIHRMRYDGKKDGIEYVTLATVGGVQQGYSADAGYLHQFHVVTVRKDRLAMTSLPVGEVQDIRKITGEVSDDVGRLAREMPQFEGRPTFVFGADMKPVEVSFTLANPTSRPLDLTLLLDSQDSRWISRPDHMHARLAPAEKKTFAFRLGRVGTGSVDEAIRLPELVVNTDYLAKGLRVQMHEQRYVVPLKLDFPDDGPNRALECDGKDDCVEIAPQNILLPSDSPLTLECWFKPFDMSGKRGLVAKTWKSEYGILISKGVPTFMIFLDGHYVNASPGKPILQSGKWYHIAGVFDGREVRLYVDGKQVAATPGSGKRKRNRLPLIVGSDLNSSGKDVSHYHGLIDAVRLSTSIRYRGETVKPERNWTADDTTKLLLQFNHDLGPYHPDASPRAAHGTTRGTPTLTNVP